MTLKDYYLANANDKTKLYLYEIIGDSTLNIKSKDCFVTVAGKTLEEAKRMLNGILNNNFDFIDLIEENYKETLSIVFKNLDNYIDLRIKKTKVDVINGEVYPRMPWHFDWIMDDEMIAYENELLKD